MPVIHKTLSLEIQTYLLSVTPIIIGPPFLSSPHPNSTPTVTTCLPFPILESVCKQISNKVTQEGKKKTKTKRKFLKESNGHSYVCRSIRCPLSSYGSISRHDQLLYLTIPTMVWTLGISRLAGLQIDHFSWAGQHQSRLWQDEIDTLVCVWWNIDFWLSHKNNHGSQYQAFA